MPLESRRAPGAADGRTVDLPHDALVASVVVEGDPRAARTARQFLRRELAGWQVGNELADIAVLCLSELVANAVQHAGTRSEVRVGLHGSTLTLVVRDQGGPAADVPEPDADPDPLRMRGRGLQLVGALAHRWGIERDELGNTVWVELDRTSGC